MKRFTDFLTLLSLVLKLLWALLVLAVAIGIFAFCVWILVSII